MLMAVDMPIRAIREQIVSAIDMVVQVARFADGRRRVTHHLRGHRDRAARPIELRYSRTSSRLRDPKQKPRLRHTGYMPSASPTSMIHHKRLYDVEVFL